ncbi:Protein kinase [Modicella reniformis]|uniref:Protein kinase n=1 Tax=Modicella reniformis TaxID=1440133 RepID=A0A9P6IKK5_9FUNG|nr:Protein kinase [Modicella reniformis]
MNTAAPNPSYTHTRQTQSTSVDVKSDAYVAERISAQEAMKDMRIGESHQHIRRKESNDINVAYGATRVDRHLASRAQSVREPSRPYAEKEAAPRKMASVERRRSSPGNTPTKVPVATASDTPTPTIPEPSANSHYNDCGSHAGQTHGHGYVAQGSPPSPQDQGSHSAPTNQFHNQKTPGPPSPSSDNCSAPSPPPSSSGRQSRLNSISSTSSTSSTSKESYRRKYGDIQGYTYIGTIGQGNFGKVLLAENDITGEKVAVKILEKAQFKSEQQRLHATREACLMATLRHSNIVDVKTVMEDDYRILIVMENLTGGELFDYISNKGSLDEKEARRIFHQIVLAIHYCHEPENILLDNDRNVRVADFGFGNNWHKDHHLTTYCGSPFYAAPEMVSGTPYIGPETDVWSLGVILYVLVCGRLPFDANDLPALFAQIKRGNYQKPREGSIDVCSLIHRMLTVDPKRRATLSDVLRSRWMRVDGLEPMVTAPPALSTAPPTVIRPAPSRVQQHQAKSTALPTHHPNNDISTTTAAPTVNTGHNRHSYHPPGTHENNPQGIAASQYQYQQQQHQHPKLSQLQTPQHLRELRNSDDQMSDVSPSMTCSPTETMATISPRTPVAPTLKEDALSAAVAAGQVPENVVIDMCPSSDTLVDGFDASLKKKRKALTKIRQFFRFETNKC